MRRSFSSATALNRRASTAGYTPPLRLVPAEDSSPHSDGLVWEHRLGMETVLGHRPRAFLRWQQRDRAAVSIGTSTLYFPLARQRESSISPHVPCERRTEPAEPSPRHQPRAQASESLLQVICCSVPFCVNRWDRPQGDRPPGDSSGAVSGRSEPWRRTPSPLAQSAKDHPPPSLLSERRPDTAEPSQRQKQSRECPLLCK